MSGFTHTWDPVNAVRFDTLTHLWEEHAVDAFEISESWNDKQAAVTIKLQLPYRVGPNARDVMFDLVQVTYIVWRERSENHKRWEQQGHQALRPSEEALST